MFTLCWIDFRSGSGIDPIQCEQCLGKSNRTGPVSSRAVHTIWDRYFCFGLGKANLYPRVQESDNEIPFQKWGRSAEQVVHISSGAFQKAIRYEMYHHGGFTPKKCLA